MKILLMDGRIVCVPGCRNTQAANRGNELECQTARGRVIATFLVANVAGWWYDNEDVSIEPRALGASAAMSTAVQRVAEPA